MLLVDLGTLLTAVLTIVIAYVVVLWLALAFYVVRDARLRTTSPGFALFAMLLGFVPPFLGALIYFMVRPPMTMEQVRSLAIEEQVLLGRRSRAYPPDRVRPADARSSRSSSSAPTAGPVRPGGARDATAASAWLGVCPYCATEVGARPGPHREVAPRCWAVGSSSALIPAPLIIAAIAVFALAPGQARAARIVAGVGIAMTIALLAVEAAFLNGSGASRHRSAPPSPGSPTCSVSTCPARPSGLPRRRPASSSCSRATGKPAR